MDYLPAGNLRPVSLCGAGQAVVAPPSGLSVPLCSGGRMIASQGSFPQIRTPPGNSQASRKGNSGHWLFSGFIDLGDTEESTREGFVSAQEMGLLK